MLKGAKKKKNSGGDNTITELKNSLEMEGFNSKLKQTEGRISKLEDRSFEIVESEDQEEKKNDEK